MIEKISKIKANDNDGWETLIDFTEIDEDGVSAETILQKLQEIEN